MMQYKLLACTCARARGRVFTVKVRLQSAVSYRPYKTDTENRQLAFAAQNHRAQTAACTQNHAPRESTRPPAALETED